MSWSCSIIGKPEAVAKALEVEAAKHTGVSREEFDAALPHLQAIVRQNFAKEGSGYTEPVLHLQASGSGYHKDGEAQHRSLGVELKLFYATLAG